MAVVRAFPVFSKGNILRQEMLLALSGYTELGDLMFEEYGNGILRGCKLTTTKEAIQVGRGVVVYDGKLLMIKEPLLIAYYPTDTLCACKLSFQKEHMVNNVLYREVEAAITEDVNSKENEIELCRFKLQPGAMLRSDYVDFEDRSTEYDTLNDIYAPFSAYKDNSLSPEILQAYGRELVTLAEKSEMDQVFCMQVLFEHRTISRESVAVYITARTGVLQSQITNYSLYHGLLQILKSVKQGQDPKIQKNGTKKWTMDLL